MSSQVDLSDPSFWRGSPEDRAAAFADLRSKPMRFFDEPTIEGSGFPPGAGYFAVVRHADVLAVSRDAETFCSGQGATSIVDIPPEFGRYFGSIINMDAPEHTRLRKTIADSFTPRFIAGLSDQIRSRVAAAVESAVDQGSGDFVEAVAERVPIEMTMDMLGVGSEHYEFVKSRTALVVGRADPEVAGAEGADSLHILLTAGAELHEFGQQLARDRRDSPTDDLVTRLVAADAGQQALTDEEVASFFLLLLVAGSETTKTGLASALQFMTIHEEQRQELAADPSLLHSATEEVLRCSSPILWFRRTATVDTEVGGVPVQAGEKLILHYWSANRDESVFDDPVKFRIDRDPNPHLAFGGPGPHFCLGASLARTQVQALLSLLSTRHLDLVADGEPDWLEASFVNGIKRLRYATN